MALVPHEVGKPHPGPITIAEGMQAILNPTEGGLSLVLLTAVPRPTATEIKALRGDPMRIGLYKSPPLAWILLDVGAISFDAPYAIGIVPPTHRDEVLAGARAVRDWRPTIRALFSLDVIDTSRGNRIEVLRAATLSREWWTAFARALEDAAAAGPLDAAGHRAAIARDQRLTTKEMFVAAAAVEIAGAV